jgi:DNA mismatch repair protein MutS2
VAFDPSTGEPQYRLEYGRSGASNALEVAERLGMPSDVLARARRYAAGGEGRGGELLRGLEEAEDRAREAAERAEALRADWEARNRQQEDLVREARRERDAVRAEFRREVRALVEEVRRGMRDAVRRLSDGAIGRAAAEAEVASLQRLAEERLGPEETEPSPGGLEAEVVPGMRVQVASLGREGEVQAVEPDGRRAVVRLGTLRVTVPLEDLRAPGEARPPEQPAPRVRVEAEAGASDVNVIGSTVEEALASVDRALDRALVAGVRGFRVVHGRGTGTLRRAVREHLASAPHVREVRPEGDAVTWIDLG